jgi:succinoglycan biosynthesis transport protein ExoP
MGFGQFFSVLRARWWVAALVLLLTVGTTLGISLMLPKKYTASASIVVDPKPDPVSGMMYPGMGSPAYMATQVDVILSSRVAQRVVRNLRLTESPEVRDQWQEATQGEGSLEGWVVGNVRKNMEVKPSLESNVIAITYTSTDPEFAAGVANAFVQAYIDTALELRVDPARQYSKFFDQRSKEARDALEQAQARLSAYQKEKGIVVSEERYDVENARLSELSSQLVLLQALSSESGSRQAQIQGGSADRMQEVLTNPLISSLQNDLSRSEARLQELTSRLGDNHPQVVEAKATINSLRNRVATETRRVTGGVGVTANINRQREAEVRAALEAQRTKVQRLRTLRDEGGVLARDMESAQRAYDAVLARLNQTSLESQTTQSNIFTLAEAYAPSEPSSPKVALNTALSVVLGCLMAVGAVLALETMDRRVRAVDDVFGAIDVPVIGVMLGSTLPLASGNKRLSMQQRRLVTSLPAPQRGN